jgi:hypothetical protein
MTASTLPAVEAQLVASLATALQGAAVDGGDIPFFPAWNPDVTDECGFLGRALLDLADRDEVEVSYEYPTVELNRPCYESYTVAISLWSFRPDLTPDQAQDARTRIGVLLDLVLAVLADVDLGIGVAVNARPERVTWRRVPFQTGWAVFAVAELNVIATLTT